MLDTYLSLPEQHAANTYPLDRVKVPSPQGDSIKYDSAQVGWATLYCAPLCGTTSVLTMVQAKLKTFPQSQMSRLLLWEATFSI